jgi:hypothetical protein
MRSSGFVPDPARAARGGTVRRVLGLVMLSVPLLSSGCVSRGEVAGQQAPPAAPTAGGLDEALDLGGVVVTIRSIEVFTRAPTGFPRLKINLRSTNTSTIRRFNPSVRLFCHESPRAGDWHLGSTWEPEGLIGAGEILEGVLYVGFPAKADDGQFAVATCTDASLHLISDRSVTGQPRERQVPVPPNLITAALVAPLGEQLRSPGVS